VGIFLSMPASFWVSKWRSGDGWLLLVRFFIGRRLHAGASIAGVAGLGDLLGGNLAYEAVDQAKKPIFFICLLFATLLYCQRGYVVYINFLQPNCLNKFGDLDCKNEA
jgi:hypothetical protein